MKYFDLDSDMKIPALGFGTWQLQGDECFASTLKALELGYRHIDTANAYGNHDQVARAIKESGVPRGEIFLTTKIRRDNLHAQEVKESCQRFMQELEVDYLDLFLVHWPNKDIPISETLGAFDDLRNEGLIKSVGVSNFTIRHLEEAIATGVKICNNQVEYHPTLNQENLLKFCQEHDILLTAYSPIARGEDLSNPVIMEIAEKYGKSPSQVILNWIIGKGIVAIPKSSNPDHIEDNLRSVDWELEIEDIERINKIGGNNRVVRPGFAEFDD